MFGRALALALIACLACGDERVPGATARLPGPEPIDRDASAEDLYFELVRLRSLGLVSAERMDAVQVSLDRIELEPDSAERARDTREAIASVLRRTLGELALVVALPAGGYLVAKLANVALKRALFLLRKARSLDHLLLESERFGLQMRVARGSTELASSIGGRPVDEALLARIKVAFERQGGTILQSPEVDRYLEMRGAEAVTDNAKQFLLKSRPTTSAVFEELIHTAQHRSGRYGALIDRLGHGEAERVCEIEAAEKLIRNAKAWGIPDEETRQTAERLARLQAESGRR